VTPLVVDASVAVKWVLDEDDHAKARRIIGTVEQVLVPELIWAEVTNVIWRRQRQGEFTIADALDLLAELQAANVESRPIEPLAADALALAVTLQHSVYDCVYLALAEKEGCDLVTADRRFHDRGGRSPFADRVLMLGDLP
jgi:predicted nucleic acid-binding protein